MGSRLDTLAFGIALSLTWGILITALGLFSTFSGQATEVVNAIATLYIGYGPTLTGTLIGTTWAVIDGMIVGLLFAAIYNKTTPLLQKHLYQEKQKSQEEE